MKKKNNINNIKNKRNIRKIIYIILLLILTIPNYIFSDAETKEVGKIVTNTMSDTFSLDNYVSKIEEYVRGSGIEDIDFDEIILYVLNYKNSGGVNDAIKIEINYSMRCHIFESELRYIETGGILDSAKIRTLAPIEIFASKINALISRAAARDLYDINNMILYSLFDEQETELLRQCVIFYTSQATRAARLIPTAT